MKLTAQDGVVYVAGTTDLVEVFSDMLYTTKCGVEYVSHLWGTFAFISRYALP